MIKPTAWTNVELANGDVVGVPATGPNENLHAMLEEIPRRAEENPADHRSHFNMVARAFLMQHGNSDLNSRYGRRVKDVLDIAIAHALVFAYHQGEAITYHALNHTMSLIANDHADIEHDLNENAWLLSETFGVTVTDLLMDV